MAKQTRVSATGKALDYAWRCDAGGLVCTNTHGLPGDQSHLWTIVGNESNCVGTNQPACGAPQPQNRPGGSQTSSIYDYVVKVASNGAVKYYGALVDGIEEVLSPITASMYQQLTGQRDVYSGDGITRLRRTQLFGNDLISYNNKIAGKYGLTSKDVDRVAKYLKKTRGMVGLTHELAALNGQGVPVADSNNMFEVFTKYLKFNPQTQDAIPNNIFNDISGLITQGRKNSLTEKSGGIDIGSIVSGGIDLLSGLIGSAFETGDNMQLQGWQNDYESYMQTDFAEIERVTSEQGLQAGLDKFLAYKNGSWLEMKNHIQTWCNNKGVEIPEFYRTWWTYQSDYESALRSAISGGGSSNSGGASGEFGNTRTPTATTGSSLSLSTVGLVIGAIVLFMFLKK